MLQTQTVVPNLLELLKKIMNVKLFENYFLVGETALALQIGHRNSIDIDLFGDNEISEDEFINKLGEFGKVIVTQSTKNILIAKIEGRSEERRVGKECRCRGARHAEKKRSTNANRS